MTYKLVTRLPEQKLLVHRHNPITPVEPSLIRRILPSEVAKQHVHYMMWNYHSKRGQWEAYCEQSDIMYYAPATPEDEPFRKGRTW